MKIGVNMLLWTGHVDEEHFTLFERLKRIGFDGVEIPIMTLAPLAHYTRIGRIARECGLELTASSGFLGDADPVSADPAMQLVAIDYLSQVIERANALSSSILIGPMYQVLGQFTGVGPTRAEYERLAGFYRVIAPVADAAGVQCVLEPLNRFEAYMLNTVEQTVSYLDKLDVPAVAAMYDTFHAHIEEKDPLAALAAIHGSGHLRHIHISENDRGTPGHGHAKLRETIKLLQSVGYDDWLTIEAFGTGVPQLAAATRVWREFFGDPEQLCRDGYRFIRETLQQGL